MEEVKDDLEEIKTGLKEVHGQKASDFVYVFDKLADAFLPSLTTLLESQVKSEINPDLESKSELGKTSGANEVIDSDFIV
jgi:hypothetical protein